jgi:NADH-quinone oxidoreductase subunit F
MEQDPHQVLEGIVLACLCHQGEDARIFYLRYEYGDRVPGTLQGAVAELYAAGLLGTNIFGSRHSTSTSSCTAGPGRTSAARRPG